MYDGSKRPFLQLRINLVPLLLSQTFQIEFLIVSQITENPSGGIILALRCLAFPFESYPVLYDTPH